MRLVLFFLLFTCSVKAQTFLGDSMSCYTKPELYQIASDLYQGDQCDSLLKITIQQSLTKDTIHKIDSLRITHLETAQNLNQQRIDTKITENKDLKSKLVRTQVTGIILVLLLSFLLVQK